MSHGALSDVLFDAWIVALFLVLIFGRKRSMTFQWIAALTLSALGIWRAVWEHQRPVWIGLMVAVVVIGVPYAAIQQHRKRRQL